MTSPKTHDQSTQPLQEKREVLREAVTSPSLSHPPGDSLRLMYLEWVRRFTVWHVRILAFLDDPKAFFAAQNRPFPAFITSSLGHVLTDAHPELKDQRSFYDLIAKDLWQNGLINTDGLHAMMSASGAGASRTTEIGREFLRFVNGEPTSKGT